MAPLDVVVSSYSEQKGQVAVRSLEEELVVEHSRKLLERHSEERNAGYFVKQGVAYQDGEVDAYEVDQTMEEIDYAVEVNLGALVFVVECLEISHVDETGAFPSGVEDVVVFPCEDHLSDVERSSSPCLPL